MSSIDHLHTEAEMRKVKEHLLSAQYLARCLEPGNVCHPITTRATPERQMKETLYTRHWNTVEPMMVKNDRKATLQALHTTAVVKAVQCHERNVVLDCRPPPIRNSEKELYRKERSTLAQQRSGYCRLLGSYKTRIKKDASLDVCADCGTTPHDVKHLFICPAHPTTLIPSDLWSRPTDDVRELSYLEARDKDWNEHGLKGEQQQQHNNPSSGVLMKSIRVLLRPDALPGVNHIRGMQYQIVLNIIFWPKLN